MTIEDLPIQTVKITGTPGNGYWSQIHTFTPENPDEMQNRGTLLAAITVATDKQGVEAVSYGRDILGRLHEEYFGNKQDTAYTCLGKAVERITIESPDSQIAVAVMLGRKIIIAVSSGAIVWLKRGDSFGQLLSSNETVELLSGELVENDTFLLSSAVFSSVVPMGTLRIALSGNLDQAAEIIGPIILGHEQSGGAVGLIFRVREDISMIKPVEIEKVSPKGDNGQGYTVPVEPLINASPKEIYLKKVRLRRLLQKIIPITVAILVILFVVFGVWKAISKVQQSRRLAKGQTLITELMKKTEEGIKQAGDDPSGLGELVVGLENEVKIIDDLKLVESTEYQQVKKQIQDLKNQVGQVGFIKEPAVFMDLGLVGNGVEGKEIVVFGKDLLVLSSDGKKIVVFDAAKKSYEENPLGSDYSQIAVGGSKVYLVDGIGISEVDLNDNKTKKVISETPWEQADRLVVYSGGLYLLDVNKSAIWRFLATESGFGAGKNWLKDEVDLSKSVDIVVDGSVWLLDKDKIRKFNLGKEESFSVSDEKFSLVNAGLIYTNIESNELLVLDRNNGRLYRIGKDGKLIKSYQATVFKNAISLASEGKKAYLLDGKKIYEVGLE